MTFLIAALVLHQATGSGQPCFPQLFPPWLPKVFSYHNNVEPVAVGLVLSACLHFLTQRRCLRQTQQVGTGYVLCCDGRWGAAPQQTNYIRYVFFLYCFEIL